MQMQHEFQFANYYKADVFVGDEVTILATSAWSRYYNTDMVFIVQKRSLDNRSESYRRKHDVLLIVPKKDWEEKNYRYAIHINAKEVIVVGRPLSGYQWEL